MRNITYILVFLGSSLFSQEPVFSDFYNNPIYLNPALAGQYQIRASFNANNQWYNIPGQLNTQTFSLDGTISPKKWNDRPRPAELVYGLYALNNQEGELGMKFNDISGLFGAKVRLQEKHVLSFPIQFVLASRKIDLTNAVFMQNLDPVLGNIYTTNFIQTPLNRNHINFHSGLNYSYTNRLKSYDSKLDIGIALHNLLGTEREGFLSHNSVNRLKTTIYFSFLKKGVFNSNMRFSGFYQSQINQKTLQIASHFTPTITGLGNTYVGTGLFFRQQFLSSTIAGDPFKTFETIYFPVYFLIPNKAFIIKTSFNYGFPISEISSGRPGGIGEITLQIINNSDNYWDICPGDKQVRYELNKKQKRNRGKLEKRRTRKVK